jgi:alpha-D-xyloside xylohydrolase
MEMYEDWPNGYKYEGDAGSIVVRIYPWRIKLFDKNGKLMTSSRCWKDNDSTQVKVLPFCFIRRGNDNSRRINPCILHITR